MHLTRSDGLAAHEVRLQAVPRLGVWALRQRLSLRSVLVAMVLHLGVVANTSDLVGAVDPGELAVDGIICAYDVFIGHPVGTDDRFVSAKQSAAALDDELGVKGNVILLSGSRSRQLLSPD